MSVQFILGRSGTGKTRHCIEAMAADLLAGPQGPALIFLVPEQATYQAERAILSHPRISGFHRLHIVSFDRLRVLLVGRGSARRRLSEVGRQMIVHRILRDLAPQLKVFGASALHPGFSRQMGQTLAELYREARTVQDLDSLVGRLEQEGHGRIDALKWGDIKQVLQEYGKAVEGRFIDPDIEMLATRKAIAKADWLRGARLWVDGFAGFSGTERLILQDLLAVVSEAHVALCLDPGAIDLDRPDPALQDRTPWFDPTEQTYAFLVQGIRDAGMALWPPVVLKEAHRFQNSPALAHVEQCLFCSKPQSPIPNPESGGRVRIWVADHPRTEAQAVARQIRSLVQDKGLRYRDIAVIAPDLEPYEPYLRASLADLEIPFFIDNPRPLSHHPLVVLIASALQSVIHGFQTRDVIAYLKTGLVPLDADQIDLLEHYGLAFGIMGSDWTGDRPWAFDDPDDPAFDQERIEAARQEAVRPLLGLKRQLGAEQGLSAEAFAQAVLGLLDRLKVEATLRSWIDQANEAADPGLADDYAQAYAWVGDIMEELVEVFGGQTADASQWVEVIGSALSQASLAMIPPTLDRVLVGSIERSRHPDLRAVFLVGTTQRQFPVPLSQAGLLTDDDRESARAAGLSLAGGIRDALAARRYLAYIALTRASEFLVVSYPTMDERGGAVTRSPFVDDLQRLFDDVTEERINPGLTRIEEVMTRHDLADLLCAKAGTDGLYASLVEEVCRDPDLGPVGQSVRTALGYRNEAILEPDVATAMMGSPLNVSASRLSTFAACPYKHFAQYLLELRPRLQFRLKPLDIGDFYHRVLDGLVKTTVGTDPDLTRLDEDVLREQVRRIVRSTIEADSFLSHFVRHSRFNDYILRQAAATVEECSVEIARMIRAGAFRPILSEVGFGGPEDTLGTFRMALSGGKALILRGRIDRIDRAETEEGKAVIVVDYKTSHKRLDWVQLYHGLDLQLPIYLLALQNARSNGRIEEKSIGAFYLPIEVWPEGGDPDEAPGREEFDRKARGLFDGGYFRLLDQHASGNDLFYSFYVNKKGEPYGYYGIRDALKPKDFAAVLVYTQAKVADLAGRILSGEIAVQPYLLKGQRPCDFCDYRSVCRFDQVIQEYRYVEKMDKARVLERIGGQA